MQSAPLTTLVALACLFSNTCPGFAQDAAEEDEPLLSSATLKGLELRSIGPALMSGRIADIAIDPTNQSTWYVAVGSGGVWKTTNAGTTWTPIFDGEASYSIGCISIDPNHPQVIWVGTGENVSGRHVGFGDGVYKSTDGGGSWKNVGLQESEHIGRILIDPRDSDTVYVAAQGPLWSREGERGLFKSTDGGDSWKLILGAQLHEPGVNEVIMDPRDSQVLYVSTHERRRSVAALVDGGPGSGIHKSVDGGATWTELTNGLPEEDMGRIGIAISPQQPDVIYATIELAGRKGGFFRSADGGASWEKRNDYISGGTGPHYYQEIFASPHAFDRVYQADVWMNVTHDGGRNFAQVGHSSKHSDNHALAFDPNDPDYLLVGCDGGMYESYDAGAHWRFSANLPVTQFYKLALDDELPFYNVYGGTQDNSTQGGPVRTDSVNGIRNADWFITVFADGHQPAVEPGNPDIIYSEWQQGHLVRHDRRTGEIVFIQPQPAADEPSERFNWDAPILISPHKATRLYYASQRVWRSEDRGDSWQAVSPDLTGNIDRMTQPIMGRVQSADAVWDLMAMSKYNTITSLAESPVQEGILYAGTDDGRIQVSEDGGAHWRLAGELPGVPGGFFVNDLKADLFDASTVYVCVDDHKSGHFKPHVLKSTDRGKSWMSITGDLPERHLAWRLVQDHVQPELLFLGTEFGLFFTVDGGERWVQLKGGVPTISFRDLAIQRRENDLVAASFGRGFYVLDDYSPLRSISTQSLEAAALLFPTRDALWYVPRRTLGGAGAASQGDAYFVAENPDFGATFTYYLREDMDTRKQRRSAAEKIAIEASAATPTPGWDALRAEDEEEAPKIVITITDSEGQFVRSIDGPAKKGIQRSAWDLRYPSSSAWKRGAPEEDYFGGGSGGLAAPGVYTATLGAIVDGQYRDLRQSQTFKVVPLNRSTLIGAGPAAVAAFQRELDEAQRQVDGARAAVDDLLERVGAIRSVLDRSAAAGADMRSTSRAMESELQGLSRALIGERRRSQAGDPGPVSINSRLQPATLGNRWSTYGPTPTHTASLKIALSGLQKVSTAITSIVGTQLPALEKRMDAAGLPWTPGRTVAPTGRRRAQRG